MGGLALFRIIIFEKLAGLFKMKVHHFCEMFTKLLLHVLVACFLWINMYMLLATNQCHLQLNAES